MQNKIQQLLLDSIADSKLNNDEKQSFKALMATLRPDERRYLRNVAFDLARDKMNTPDAGEKERMSIIAWLERIVKLVDQSEKEQTVNSRAYFSPGDECRNEIINLLGSAKKRVDICVFTISDNRITEAILKAHKRGVDLRILSDNDKANDRGSDVYRLQDSGIPVAMDTSPSHMHHKFALIDAQLINGSFNWTRSATDRNQENIVVTDHAKLIESFDDVFNRLWKRFY